MSKITDKLLLQQHTIVCPYCYERHPMPDIYETAEGEGWQTNKCNICEGVYEYEVKATYTYSTRLPEQQSVNQQKLSNLVIQALLRTGKKQSTQDKDIIAMFAEGLLAALKKQKEVAK